VQGIGLNDESWGVEYGTVEGDTEQDDVWEQLAERLSAKYQRDGGVELGISAVAIDMRHNGQKVRQFVRQSGLPRVYPVYGIARPQPLLVTPRFSKHYRLRTFAVATKNAKDTIYARLRIEEEGPRYMHFPKGNGYDGHYFEMLTAEVLKTKYSAGIPAQSYELLANRRNEALDIRVYILGALDILKPNLTSISKKLKALIKKEGESQPGEPKDYPLKEPAPGPTAGKADATPKKPVSKAKPDRPSRPPGSGFVGRWKKA
jgi:phage terminase large subunit GpA-like protein